MIVLCSGGFDPIHIGHLRYLEAAAKFGSVIVALNSDDWLVKKKGYLFMSWDHRAEILMALKYVTEVLPINDSDGTICEAFHSGIQFFANGGDRTKANKREGQVCEELGIKQLFNIGGDKIASSSALVKTVYDYHANAV